MKFKINYNFKKLILLLLLFSKFFINYYINYIKILDFFNL